MTPSYILMLGPSGSGKGSVAKGLATRFRLPHVSTGDHLRAIAATPGHRFAAEAAAVLNEGRFARAPLMYAVVKGILAANPHGLILDGFPRKAPQARWLIRQLPTGARVVALLVDAPDDVVTARMLARGRADDTPANIANRLKEYHRNQRGLLQLMREKGWLRTVNGNQPPPQVLIDADCAIRRTLGCSL